MYWYYYLNYKIYRFYQRKKDSTPVEMAILAITVLFYCDFFLIPLFIVDLFQPFLTGNYNLKMYGIILLVLIYLLNRFLLYRNKYYEEIFDYFDKYEDKYKKWDLSVLLYIVLSILSALALLVFKDGKNNGYW